MLSTLSDALLIPYGTDRWSFADIRMSTATRSSLRVEAAFPCALVNLASKNPLRLNGAGALLTASPPSGGGVEAALREALRRLCRPWDRLALRFIDAYFHHVAQAIAAERHRLEARLAPFAGLYRVEDWLFSAPLPLPRAHVCAPWAVEAPPEARFVAVDFALWLGDRLAVALPVEDGLAPMKARERLDRLARAGIAVTRYAMSELGAPGPLFQDLLGGPIARFFDSEIVPSGPLRPTALDD